MAKIELNPGSAPFPKPIVRSQKSQSLCLHKPADQYWTLGEVIAKAYSVGKIP